MLCIRLENHPLYCLSMVGFKGHFLVALFSRIKLLINRLNVKSMPKNVHELTDINVKSIQKKCA
jgi:hypothetical protein